MARHNSLSCNGGCTADLGLLPDDNFSHVTVDGDLLVATPNSAYCLYGGGPQSSKHGKPTYVVVTNNISTVAPAL